MLRIKRISKKIDSRIVQIDPISLHRGRAEMKTKWMEKNDWRHQEQKMLPFFEIFKLGIFSFNDLASLKS